eukprot:CAMPEP_0198280244 /NCGR_PEP_ID=MMETSP1449-20131203/355_1 /TAXON_ID=420275 /ORGANISM="Attheya septentrionalis, Strain CCMP2084" /LENGTH=238 /DNA_ID=CAMNT_0043975537 /DNA_START=71 /DNA_END=787 /DNA_ORIENTATION=-
MKIFISFSGLLVVGAGVVQGAAFLPVKGTTRSRLATTRSMTIIDDWKNVFGSDGIKKRTEQHEREMEEMVKAEKEILERRRDPRKMKQYHENEEARHRMFDNKHDLDIEKEVSKERVIHPKHQSLKRVNKVQSIPKPHSKGMFDDLMNYFSPNETQHRIEVHKEQMEDMEEAEHEILELRRDPHKMKAYHQQEEVRHHKFDMMRDADVEKELSQEWVEGGGFMDNLKNTFGGKKNQKK